MRSTTDVAIVGGGIAGLTIALAAAARGLSVTVIHRRESGFASTAAAGMLAPSLEGMPPHVLPHALAARDFYPEFLASLFERTGLRVELNRLGIIELADREDELSRLRERALPGAVMLKRKELRDLEPALAPHAGAVLHPQDGAVDNVALMAALERAVEMDDRIKTLTAWVTRVHLDATPFVETGEGDRVHAAWVVLAGGAWMAGLAGLPAAIPVRPVRGQLLSLGECPLSHVMYAPRTGYLVPRGGALVVGATTEHTGFVTGTSEWGRQELLEVVARTLPALKNAPASAHWAGLRPMSPDTLPILGPDPGQPRLVYAGGFSRNGILLAPWAAEALAELLDTERSPKLLDSFNITRFGSAE